MNLSSLLRIMLLSLGLLLTHQAWAQSRPVVQGLMGQTVAFELTEYCGFYSDNDDEFDGRHQHRQRPVMLRQLL